MLEYLAGLLAAHLPVLAQHRVGEAVERAAGDALGDSEAAEAVAELLGCLAGECDGDDGTRVGGAVEDPAGDAPGEDTGLAGPGAGEDAQGGGVGEDGLGLGRREAGAEVTDP